MLQNDMIEMLLVKATLISSPSCFFFLNDRAPTEIPPLPLPAPLPFSRLRREAPGALQGGGDAPPCPRPAHDRLGDRPHQDGRPLGGAGFGHSRRLHRRSRPVRVE